MSNKNPLVLIKNLQIKYDDKAIFKPLSFEINNGDRVAITGKNGIGKSSILKLILGDFYVTIRRTQIEIKKT